jgi:hypothetical protein
MRKHAIRMGLAGMLAAACSVAAALAKPLSDPTTADLERLRPASGAVVVVEFYDQERRKIDAKSMPAPARPQQTSGTQFTIAPQLAVNLWGLSPCSHERRLIDGSFDGSCRDFIQVGLRSILKSGPVILCRSFVDQKDRPVIDASCFVLVSYTSVYGVTKIEEFLVSGGYALLVRDAAGKALRPDLEDDERIAKGFGRGLWSFEHERVRREQRN